MSIEWTTHPLLVVVNVLAAFRITRFIVADAFPFGPLRQRFTDWANQRWGPLQAIVGRNSRELTYREQVRVQAYEHTAPLAYLLACYWCAGLYVSVVVTLLASTGLWWVWVAAPLALSAAIGLLAALD